MMEFRQYDCLLCFWQFLRYVQRRQKGPGQAASLSQPNFAPAAEFQQRSPRWHIEAGDSFDITELSPEFNQTGVAVQPDGFVTARSWRFEGCRPDGAELTQTLHGVFEILNDPLISVVPEDFEKPYFVADGQVASRQV